MGLWFRKIQQGSLQEKYTADYLEGQLLLISAWTAEARRIISILKFWDTVLLACEFKVRFPRNSYTHVELILRRPIIIKLAWDYYKGSWNSLKPFVGSLETSHAQIRSTQIFDAMPGDIFALRNAGNTCTHAEGLFGSGFNHKECTASAGARSTLTEIKCLQGGIEIAVGHMFLSTELACLSLILKFLQGTWTLNPKVNRTPQSTGYMSCRLNS